MGLDPTSATYKVKNIKVGNTLDRMDRVDQLMYFAVVSVAITFLNRALLQD